MKKRWLYTIMLLPFIIGLIVGSFKDYEIAEAVFVGTDMSTNAYGVLFSAFGPIISYTFLTFVAGYYLRFAILEKDNKWLKAFFIFVTIGAYAISIFFTQHKVISINAFDYRSGQPYYVLIKILIIIGCTLILFPIYLWGYKTAVKKPSTTFLYSMIALFFVYAIALVPITQICKIVMRRPRYRIACLGTYDAQFFNWWEPNTLWDAIKTKFAIVPTLSEEFKSLPSGHTCEASMLMISLPYLTLLDEKFKRQDVLLCIIGFLYTMLMGISRMTMGAHYLSDVSFGVLMMSVPFVIGNEINIKIFSSKQKSN